MPLKVEYMMPPLDELRNRKLAIMLRKILKRLENTWLKYFACHIIVISTVEK